MLDDNNYIFIYVYPFVSILGITSIFLLSKIKLANQVITKQRKNIFSSVKDSIQNMFSILKNNKPYRDFEFGFMF